MLHRHARPAVAGAYLFGAISGALVTTSALLVLSGLLSPVPATLRSGLALVGIAGLLVRSAGLLDVELPQRRYQIPRATFGPSPTRSAYRFAFELGTGVRTYITASAPYALAATLVLSSPASLGTAVLCTLGAAFGYGLGRSVVVVGQAMHRSVAVDHPRVWLRAADIVSLTGALLLVLRI